MPKTELAFDTCYDLRGFGVSRKCIENPGQKGSTNAIEIELWALRGRIFEILGGFLRGRTFYGFSIYNNSVENP